MTTAEPQKVPLFIDGQAVPAVGGATFPKVSPAHGTHVADVALAGDEDVDRAVAAAARALEGPWRRMAQERRLALLERVAREVSARAEAFVAAEVRDTGKPRRMVAGFDIPRSADNLLTFAQIGRGLSGESFFSDTPDGAGATTYTLRVPLGVVGLVCPWNLPLVLLTWKLAPALAAGNTVVVKPSEETPTTAILLGQVMKEVGVPDGVYNVVHGYGAGGAGEAIVRHPGVAGISFTGESATGQAIMAAAAPGLKKLSLELGGKNPAIIFADADFEQALTTTARSVFTHSGQICLCTERIYVERPIYARFVEAMGQAARALRAGDPEDDTTTLGPLISRSHLDKVLSYYEAAREGGATIIAGGGVPKVPPENEGGFFVEPTVWTDLPAGSRCRAEEIFGPVCHVEPFDTEEEAIALANDSMYGLSASVWTRDGARAGRLARALEVGVVWVNTWLLRDLRTPFGGLKRSGLGREGGVHSFEFFAELRTVSVKL